MTTTDDPKPTLRLWPGIAFAILFLFARFVFPVISPERAFYGFMEIDWLTPNEARELAEKQDKPIFAVVLWGGLDEQSC